MLRAGQSLPPKGLSTLRFDAGRFPPTPAVCYRASWQLPGPDSHRLADTSLRVDYLNATTSKGDITSRTHAAGLTKSALAEQAVDTARTNQRRASRYASIVLSAQRSHVDSAANALRRRRTSAIAASLIGSCATWAKTAARPAASPMSNTTA